MLPPYNLYWFRIDNKHMTGPLLDQALMESAYKCELCSDIQTNKQAPWNPALSGWFSIKVNPLNFKLGQIGPGVQEL